MRLRHHHEADVLCAVQRLDWEWKTREVGSGGQSSTAAASTCSDLTESASATLSTSAIAIHVPLVIVDDDFNLQPV